MEEVPRLSGGSHQGIQHSPIPPDKVSSTSIPHVQCCHTANKDSCSSLLPRCPVTHCHVCAWNPGRFCMPLIPSAKRNFRGLSLEASRVLRGARVLARRETDGCYYLGHIVQELEGSREGFLVEFDQNGALKGRVQRGQQETPLYDIVHYEDARRQPLAPGDRVLAPWEAPAKRFGPGTVLRVVESTEAPSAHNERGVLVNFWNGQTKEVSSAQALRIPMPLSERIILELQMPLAARQMVVDSSLDYPYLVAPGYRASGHYRQGHLGLGCCPEALYSTHPCAKCSWGCTSLPQGCLGAWEHTRPAGCKVQQENTFSPRASLTEDKLSKKIEQELSELRIASTESVSREEEKKEEKRLETENIPEDVRSSLEEDYEVIETEKGPQREMARAVVDAAVNTDSWLVETDHKEEAESRQQDAETEANFEHDRGFFESRVAEAPVQHSQRSPPMGSSALVPFRCQSFFAQVNQSLEKDSLTIRSALCGQRPHSATPLLAGRATHLPKLPRDKNITKSIPSGASQKRWKELDFSRAKIEHTRWQEEQRQLKRQQQQEADGTRRDSQRQRLRQRTLQGLEKQLEHKERALQHMALLQAAEAERSRKESCFPEEEEEERKARQRLQLLKTRHLQREELQTESNNRSCEQEKERLELLRSRMQSRQEVLEQESQEQDKQQNQHQAAKVKVFQRKESSHLKMEKEGQKLCALQQYLREQKLLLLRASLLE
ncbi:inner centromere protein-like [Ammospiza caudacuta]|uniref:inner centromere protein-like n=1 Tax=Ammospiza caudacuta TaxID=2857398 RepID=UPI00273831BD|nr:inner centromere protein-like [Ammospiza caudacuta]